MDSDHSGSAFAAGETSGEKNIPSSPTETENSEEKREEEEDGEKDVDIMKVSDEEGEMEADIKNTDRETSLSEMETEGQKEDDYMKESTQSESDQESSGSDGDDEEGSNSRIFYNLPPNFPSEFTKLIDDPESIRPRILMEKKLHRSDVDRNRNRLSISAKKLKEAFLLPEEEARLNFGEVMEVELIEPNGGSISSVTLRRRRIRNWRQPSYVFTGEWRQVLARNNDVLKRNGNVRVWYIRVDGGRRLWFAIQVLEDGKEEDREAEELTEKWWGQNVFAP